LNPFSDNIFLLDLPLTPINYIKTGKLVSDPGTSAVFTMTLYYKVPETGISASHYLGHYIYSSQSKFQNFGPYRTVIS
jgi:hypothetical protein